MSKKILVIEDDPDLLELLVYNLHRAGYEVDVALDGVEGLHKARTASPDLVLLDLMLPRMDGISVCETLRRVGDSRGLLVLMMTARAGEIARLTSLAAGANDYLAKPFGMTLLVQRVAGLLSTAGQDDGGFFPSRGAAPNLA